MRYRFDRHARIDLSRTLARHGCKSVNATVSRIESLAGKYHADFIGRGILPARSFVGEATRLLHLANLVCLELGDGVSRATRRQLERARRARGEAMSLSEYGQAVNDVCMFALYAQEEGKQAAAKQDAAVDRALIRLNEDILAIWKEVTGSEMPKLPILANPGEPTWRQVRRLQQHPMWIIHNALGIFLGAWDINRFVGLDRRKRFHQSLRAA
jgi:hypothetical protein